MPGETVTTHDPATVASVNGTGGRAGALPNLVVIGAQKCGTSGLHYHLSLHPRGLDVASEGAQLLHQGAKLAAWLAWYGGHFDARATVRGEASPNYTAYPHHLGVPERMRSLVPDARLIYVVRDPLERIAAHWVHNYAKRREKGDLRSTLVHPNTSYVIRSQYHMQLQQFLNHYPREQVLVLEQQDFRTDRARTLRKVFEFVGVDPSFDHPSFARERHQTSRKTRATRLAARMERLSKSRRGRLLPAKVWFALDEKLPLRRPIERPDVRGALSEEVLGVSARTPNGSESWSAGGSRAGRYGSEMSDESSGGVKPGEGGRGRGRRGKNERKGDGGSHPGGDGAVLGVRLIRYSGIQGVSLVSSNLTHFISLLVVAHFLDPSGLGRYSLLLFLSGLITQIFHLASKPGTLRRTFGADDEDDDDDEDEEETVTSPQRSLGVGLVWSAILGAIAVAIVVVFQSQIADLLLGDSSEGRIVVWAAVLGGVGIVFKLGSLTLWLERRPTRFIISDSSRPVFNLIAITALVASGKGVEGAIVGATIGTTVATALTLFLLRGSYELAFDLNEIWAIFARGRLRAPVVTSFWIVQQADVFILSRFLDHGDVGIYRLGSQLGFVVSFLPQGFRMAMRPLRRSAAFEAVKKQYGSRVARGQLLGYFVLLCITSVLLMVLGGEVLVNLAPASYAAAAPLIPLSAAAMVMPALLRTINQNTGYPGRRKGIFQILVVLGAALYVAFTIVLVPQLGIYSPPVAMLAAFGLCGIYLFVGNQRSNAPIAFPYREVVTGLVLASVIAVGFKLLPETSELLELAIVAALMLVYFAALFFLRVIPESHWPALAHMVGSVVSGRADRFHPRAALRALEPSERDELRVAIVDRVPLSALRASDGEGERYGSVAPTEGTVDGVELMLALRRAGRAGGMQVRPRGRKDALVAKFLFADEPTAVRQATMRRLLNEGANPAELRALEDLVDHLAKVPDDAWEGKAASESGGPRRRVVGRASRNAVSRAARGLGRRI